jgi:hypothetical protein
MRSPRRANDLIVPRLRATVAKIVADRAVQQRSVLGNHANPRAQALLGDARDVLIIDEDAPAQRFVEAQQQIDEGGLSGP